MANIPVAVQMYTLREECEKDFVGTLEKVAEIGYQGVEFAGYYGMPAKDLKKVIDQLGLKAVSSHIPLDSLQEDLLSVIEYQREIGSNKIVCPFIAPEQRTEEGYSELIRSLNDIGQECSKEGITLSYHNHDFELERLRNGKTALETILDETNPEWVKAEFDIYWLTRAGEDPVEWMRRYQDRTPLVHLKDMTMGGEKVFAELGTGGVDLNAVLNQENASNVEWWIVEQDRCNRSPLESIEISMNYFLSKHS
ncbi:sugar phosphate isomerase/epimerase family protein [Guptibacillus hwajinpoensis]|uniref:Sugar phosphate isomerase/epimerase n=1 Tax=Guptibacillus hwajinpoensis TaxID=208199 RepID=A0ABU0K1V9_9BACL|nr:sugar phosphate isomerase/epimerase [Alkalihalobacillus hemicentroti]MDQ0482471.1 sugar phosphate isomerase/epimerase [Alkalihalobacillus hemicentroti]